MSFTRDSPVTMDKLEEIKAEEAKAAVKKYRFGLVKLLPINDLVTRLCFYKLLPPYRKKILDNLISPQEKIEHFLDELLTPSLSVGYTGYFDEMVNMMKESNDVLITCLVEKLTKPSKRHEPLGDDSGIADTGTYV